METELESAMIWIRKGEAFKLVLIYGNPTPLIIPKSNCVRAVEVEGWLSNIGFFEKIISRRFTHPNCRCYIA